MLDISILRRLASTLSAILSSDISRVMYKTFLPNASEDAVAVTCAGCVNDIISGLNNTEVS